MKPLSAVYFGNPVWAWMTAALVAAVSVSAAALLRRFLEKRLERGPEAGGIGRRALLRAARRTSLLLVLGLNLWAACLILSLPDKAERTMRAAAILALAVQGALWVHSLITMAAEEG